jgi:hypothetical protein
MPVEKIPEFEPPPIDPSLMRTTEGRREWVQEFCRKAAEADFRHALEQRRDERLRNENPLMRFAFRVFGRVLVDPLDVMFGPKRAGPQEK